MKPADSNSESEDNSLVLSCTQIQRNVSILLQQEKPGPCQRGWKSSRESLIKTQTPRGWGGMTLQLRTSAAFAGDLCLVPHTHTGANSIPVTPVQVHLTQSSPLQALGTCVVYTHVGKTLIHAKFKKETEKPIPNI